LADHREHVVASIATRLAIGAYPLAFVLAFGWVYGKQAFDTAAAANNWANYLNILLLSGFVVVPPAVARLRGVDRRADDLQLVRDHIALTRALLLLGAFVAIALWASAQRAFPALAATQGSSLSTWCALFAILVLAQVPLTLWLGIAQAAGKYRTALAWVVAPRAIALVVLVVAGTLGAGPTSTLGAAVTIVVAGQYVLARSARTALRAIDQSAIEQSGQARRVLAQNLSAGAIGLVGTLVTIVPVTLVGRLLPGEVGHAHVIVTLSNAIGAVIVAAFFPLSLTLAQRAREPGGLWRHCLRVARGVGLASIALIAAGWIAYPICAGLSSACSADAFAVGSLVVLGAGLRLATLGAYHAAVYQGHPHYSLLSASAEAIAVVGLTWWALGTWMLYALGVAFVVGGCLRLLIALAIEMRWLAARGV